MATMTVQNLLSILSSMPQQSKIVVGNPKSFLNGTHGAIKCQVHGVHSDFTNDLYSVAESDGSEAVCILTESL
jgi:hypothetical protein